MKNYINFRTLQTIKQLFFFMKKIIILVCLFATVLAKKPIEKKNNIHPELNFAGLYMLCEKRYFSFLDIKRNGTFLWEYHDEEGRIFNAKGPWQYLVSEKKLFLNPNLKLQKEIRVQVLDKENVNIDSPRTLKFFLNGKKMEPNSRTKISINQEAFEELPEELQIVYSKPIKNLAIEFNPGLKAQTNITEDALNYNIYLEVPQPNEILLRNVSLVSLEYSWIVEQNIEYPDLFFQRQINTSKRFFQTNSKDMNSCERNVNRVQQPDNTGTANPTMR